MSERYGPKVRWLRQGARLSGRELCRQVGISPSYLSDIETGRRLPAPATSDRIAAALAVERDGLWRLALLERLSDRDLRVLIGYSPHALSTEPSASLDSVQVIHDYHDERVSTEPSAEP